MSMSLRRHGDGRIVPALFAISLLSAACASDDPAATQLLIGVHADSALAAKLSEVVVHVYTLTDDGPQGSPVDAHFPLSGNAKEKTFALPLSFGVLRGAASRLRVEIEGLAFDEQTSVVEQKINVTFVPGRTAPLTVYLSGACYQLPKPCGPDSTCNPATRNCVAVTEQKPLPSGADPLEPPTPPAPSCAANERDCDGPDGGPRVCVDGLFEAAAACAEGEACAGGSCTPCAGGTCSPPPCSGSDCEQPCEGADASRCACDDGSRDCAGEGGAPRVCNGGQWQAQAACAAGRECAPARGECVVSCPASACTNGSCTAGAAGYTCSCQAGFMLQGNQACVDIPECASASTNLCGGGVRGGDNGAYNVGPFVCEERTPYYACKGMLADWEWRPNAAGRFVIAGDVVRDTTTGLEWERALSAPTDIGWEAGKQHCAGLGVPGTFRMPTYVELTSLIDDDNAFDTNHMRVALDETLFPNQHDVWYWSSTALGTTDRDVFVIVQVNGVGSRVSNLLAYQSPQYPRIPPVGYRVRCVRDGAGGGAP